LCTYVFELKSDPDALDTKDRDLKRTTLLELISFLTVFKPSFTEEQLADVFEMIHANIFRSLPPTALEMYDPAAYTDEDAQASESAWPHLQVVYEFLLRLATATDTDPKLLDRYFTHDFVLGLLELFDSEDPRERDYLKTILHRLYGNFMSLRPFIRRAINNVFFRLIYETDRHNGVAELLEILGSIINGFALPLKEQHKQFLAKVLLPLHKATGIAQFHPQLSYCVTQFLEKDPNLASKIITAIINLWPQISSKKELMFLNELEEVLDRVQARHLGDAQPLLFAKLAACISSPHFQISERALFILNNNVIVRFINTNRSALLPLLAGSLLSNTHLIGIEPYRLDLPDGPGPIWMPGASTRAHGHWNQSIVELTADVLKLFAEMDQGVMRQCKERFDVQVASEAETKRSRREAWRAVTAAAEPVMAKYKPALQAEEKARRAVLSDPPHSIRK
jgi:serine/threonine-protein phosphatase 2A regulatory subunit B'